MGYWNRKRNGFTPERSKDTSATNYTTEQINAMYAKGDVVTGEDGEPMVVPRPELTGEEKQAQYESKVDSLIRERYTLSQELSILRQQESKSEEYQAYFDYCEECKAKAKIELQGGIKNGI
ncbi:MAG: hypothetical protein HDT32_05060 [Clostridiales bacterium]|nr:hypothetical protein [Clostridiales bacterium]